MTRLQKVIDAALAVFLLATIFTFGYKTVWENRDSLMHSVRSLSRLKAYMPEDYNALDMFAARVSSFDATLNNVMWKKDELGYLNSTFQYALGKKMIATGKYNMATLPTGDLYDLPQLTDTTGQTDEIIAFAASVDAPLTYVYEHPTTYEGNLPQGGYAMLDEGTRMSDKIVADLEAGGIDVIDSRDILSGMDTADIVLRTDQHWTSRAALIMAREIAKDMGLDYEKLDIAKFESETYPEKFLGKYGQKVGPGNVRPDDITVFWPAYDTCIERYTLNNEKEETVSGTFKEAVIKWENLEGEGWNIDAYRDYGLTEDFEHFHNEAAPDVTILVYKDSYSAPIAAFLSLVARDVYAVDMRKSTNLAEYYVEEYEPDRILMAYSRQMLCDNEYDLMEGY
jgi:hypothetical protein